MTDQIWQISQSHLNLFATCPRKFQYIYIEQLLSPCVAQQSSNLALGNRFHRFMQQRELGLPTEAILAADQALHDSFQALANVAPNIVYPQPNTSREAEHRRTLLKGNFLLTGIYDLLICQENQAQIIDWKTYPKPPNSKKIINSWQTRLYLYLLAETSAYPPDAIQFIYWFVHLTEKPQCLTIQYNEEKHQATTQDLNKLLTKISQSWKQYQQTRKSFPQVEESKGYCLDCPFTLPCERYPNQHNLLQSDIEEVVI